MKSVAAVIVFIEAGAVLVLEILSVRLLAPYVGLTLQTTTSVIGAVLMGISIGAAVGGKVADRVNVFHLITGLLIMGGTMSLFTVPIIRLIGPDIVESGTLGALVVTFITLVPTAAVLSAISPAVAHWQLRDLAVSGSVIGRLSAWGTAGALVGTFGTGYVLVPLLPVSVTIFCIGVVLVTIGVVFGCCMHVVNKNVATGIMIITALVATGSLLTPHPCKAETEYHCINISNVPGYPSSKYLYLDTENNSFIDLSDSRDLGTFHYTRWVAESIDGYKSHKSISALFVGAGAFTLPKWLLATHPKSHVTVLEVDGKLVEYDKQHLGLRTAEDLKVLVGDARITIRKERTRSANVVIGDAFSGLTVPWQLTTKEWLGEVRRVLKQRGFYVMNMIDFYPFSLLRSEVRTLLTVFTNIRMIARAKHDGMPVGGNEVLIASNGSLPLVSSEPADGATVYNRAFLSLIFAKGVVLTDNYAPVEQLQTRTG